VTCPEAPFLFQRSHSLHMPFHTQLIFFRSTTSFRLLSRLPSLCLSFLFQRKYSLMCFFTKKNYVFFQSTNTFNLLSRLSSLCLQQSAPRVNVKGEKKSPAFPPSHTPRNFVYKICLFFLVPTCGGASHIIHK